MENKKTTIDPQEVEQFSRMAEQWWNARGPFKPLHDINPLRVEWIIERLQSSGFRCQEEINPKPETRNLNPLKGVSLLDIGCGGGLICEPMARLGAHVMGIDASEKNIAVAKLHAEQSGLAIDYRCTTAEDLAQPGAWKVKGPPPTAPSFDVVLALEIVEHVADVPLFVQSCAALVKPGGLLIMSTLNRTLKSYAMAIIGAEYVLRLLPRGTHDWNKFLRPSELHRAFTSNGIEVTEMTGMVLNPLKWEWRMDAKDLSVNYLIAGRKPSV